MNRTTALFLLPGLLVFCLSFVTPVPAWACSKHGTNSGNDIEVEYGGDPDGDGMFLFTIGIEDEIVEPTEATTCVTAIGLGSTARPLPRGIAVISARVDRVNRLGGQAFPVEYFRFAADPETSSGVASGGGSGPSDPRPLIDGASWFGFSSRVDPFNLETATDEYVRMTFEVLVPEALVPLLADVQFASGEGLADGTPIFSGGHPVQYYTADDPLAELRKFRINAGLNDAWFDPETDGQGFLIIVFPDIRQVFMAWFTYDTERPPSGVTAMLGEPGHRWLTAQGEYQDDVAVLDVYVTAGGVFDSQQPMPVSGQDGQIIMEFSTCNSGKVTYDIPSVDRQGIVPIQRIVSDNIPACLLLDEQAGEVAVAE